MSITLFGTCRLNKIHNHNNLNNYTNYCHSTKEVIQLILFLKGEFNIPYPYNIVCFRTAICANKPIPYNNAFRTFLEKTDTFVIEICSRKKYIHNGFYMHHLPFDKLWHKFDNYNHMHYVKNTPPNILNTVNIEIQSDEEIEQDILKIREMLRPKKIVIVSHYNSKINGEYIPSRNNLIRLLDNICKTHDIPFIDPAAALSEYPQDQVMMADLGHYTEFGINKFTEYANRFINR